MTQTTEYIPLLTGTALTQRQIIAHHFGIPGARPKAYIQASLHADEIPGMLVAHHLLKLLDQANQEKKICGEIIVIPIANPIGLSQFMNAKLTGRYELGGAGNFNRNWPDLYSTLPETIGHLLTSDANHNTHIIRQGIKQILDQATPFSETSSLKLTLARLAFDSDFVLDLHCDDEALVHLFLTPAHWPDATDLAAELESYASLLCADSGGQSFDESLSTPWIKLATDFPNLPIPAACMAVTVEHRGSADVQDELALKDAQAIFRFLQRRKLILGNPGILPPLLNEATDLTACDIVKAPAGGIVVYLKKLGEEVKKGEVIAEIVNPAAIDLVQSRIPVMSATDGFILSRRLDHFLRPHDTIAKVVGKTPLPHRHGLLLED